MKGKRKGKVFFKRKEIDESKVIFFSLRSGRLSEFDIPTVENVGWWDTLVTHWSDTLG